MSLIISKSHLVGIHHNPYGITYNPFSIVLQLDQILSGYTFDKEDLFFHDGLYHSFQHHGSFSAPNPTTTIENIERRQADFSDALSTANCLILTLGTAFVFRHNPTGTDCKIIVIKFQVINSVALDYLWIRL